MEPFLSFLISVLANLATKSGKFWKENVLKTKGKIQSEVKKAVIRSLLSAHQKIVLDCHKELYPNKFLGVLPIYPPKHRDALKWLDQQRDQLAKALEQLKQEQSVKMPFGNMNSPLNLTDSSATENIQLVKEKLIAEILKNDDVPDCYQRRVKSYLFDQVCDRFEREIKYNPQVNNFITHAKLTQLLPQNSDATVTLTLDVALNKLSTPQLFAIVEELKQHGMDVTLNILEIEAGSVKLVLEGSQQGIKRIEELFKSGQLTEVSGIQIKDVHVELPLLSPHQIQINLSQWLQNIFEEGWQTVETLLGTEKATLAFSFRNTASIAQAKLKEATLKKLVVINLGEGNFEQGFPVVSLEIGNEGERPTAGILGKLLPSSDVQKYYDKWRSAYRSLGGESRLGAKAEQTKNISLDEINVTANLLKEKLNLWLNSELFRPIKDSLLDELNRDDEVRVIIQTEDVRIRGIPWQLWDFFEHRPKTEVALARVAYQRFEKSHSRKSVRILAILGNHTGINVETDKQLLGNLPDAEIEFLVEPQRQELNQYLWDEQGWDIISFSGHSRTVGQTGQIDINPIESLTITDLEYALKNAIERGLHLAIFNSCDGLGLAWQLENLHIPQIIVMREPVPDQVAQEFLKYFLQAFSQNKSFYLAVKEAREQLQGIENQFPNATWLPVICQNPSEVPPAWNKLGGGTSVEPTHHFTFEGIVKQPAWMEGSYEPMFDSILSKKSPSLFTQLQEIRIKVIPDLEKIPSDVYCLNSVDHARAVLSLVYTLYSPVLESSFNANELFVLGVLCLVHDVGMMPINGYDNERVFNSHYQYSYEYVISMVNNKLLDKDIGEKIAKLCLIHNKRIGRARSILKNIESPELRLVLIYAMFKIADMLEVEQQPGAILRTIAPNVITNNIGEFDIDSESQILTFYPTPEADPKYFDMLVKAFSDYFKEAEKEFKMIGLNYKVIAKQ